MTDLEKVRFIIKIFKRVQSQEVPPERNDKYEEALKYLADTEKRLLLMKEVEKTIRAFYI